MPPLQKAYRYFTNPDLLGGDIDLRLVPLEPAHFAQTDTSLNKLLWAVFPVNAWGAEELADTSGAQ
ncbi:hypothetical protein A1Q2_02737 [Trichosporon asahii var. asahii CBS 8904]|jgi:hypothetical protein|uniref:Uncharacterized protein n=1 Tax=Trichosporon asahii var. asahii (strain CBS 8904) TaxID=1220162 RepID=K1VQP5_TRIAC|nr:hypothetical protein A1Q2_02737 [Trichosporon asahii var. asahii CBS 8904]